MSETEAGAQAPAEVVPLTFDIHWIDGDRAITAFVGITGSIIEDGFLTLHGDRITHLINLKVVSHVNIWSEIDDQNT